MTTQGGSGDRSQRVRRLRDGWREHRTDDDEPASPGSEASDELLESEALDSTDQIRAEAPDDLETRRAADQAEREIKRSRRSAPKIQ